MEKPNWVGGNVRRFLMRNRLLFGALSVLGLIFPLTGCTNPSGLDSIVISPSTQSLAVGQTTQLNVTGTYGNANHLSTKPVTAGVTWSSNTPSVATVDATGIVTGIGNGTSTITATAQGFNGPVSSSATVTVGTSGGTGGSGGTGTIVSIAVIPSSQSVATAGQTTQFIAIGTSSTGATSYLTNVVAWSSSTPAVATIGAATGLATAVGAGTTTITALYTSTTGSVVTGIATLTVSAGASEQVTSLTLLPSSLSLTASGQTSQLILLGVAGPTGLTDNLTSSPNVTWTSTTPTVATVNTVGSPGLVTAVNAGSSTIIAQYSNTDGSVVTANVQVSVTISGTGTSLESITSLTVIPSSITVNDFQLTGQFLAIGTFSVAPFVRDLTNDPSTTWLSSEPNLFPVNTNSGGGYGASAGIVSAFGSGNATIIAESRSADGTIQSSTATFNCPEVLPLTGVTDPSCYPGEPLASQILSTLTVYNRGLNTTNWEVTAPSATGTADVLHCGPGWTGAGGSVCTASYPTTTTKVVLTSPAGAGAFGGWSSNCTPSDAAGVPIVGQGTPGGPNYCTVSLVTDDTVGIIVN
jgi:uncharacterized protein YjdB